MSTKPEFVVFYAWQSDRPVNRNRYLIQEAAAQAAEQLNADPASPYHVRIDQDTQGVPGRECDPTMEVDVLTPRSIVRAIAAGYRPVIHPSAERLRAGVV